MTDIPESTKYDNYLDKESKVEDAYTNSILRFFDEDVEIPFLPPSDKSGKSSDYVRVFKVTFHSPEDHLQFCNHIGQIVPFEKNEIYYPEHAANALFAPDEVSVKKIDMKLIRPKKKIKPRVDKPKHMLNDWRIHWKEMPEYPSEIPRPYKQVFVKVRTEEDVKKFEEIIGTTFTEKTRFLHYPLKEKNNNLVKRWIGPLTQPKYPVYIVSKGRSDTMLTSRTFAKMQMHHYIIIEPQDHEKYTEALEKFNINPYATLLVAPFSNHGDGPGRARNWAWDHSITLGAKRHWVFDDNIKDFYRLHRGARYRIMTGSIFNAMEDFVDRYTNVMIAGPNYYFFCAPGQFYPPYVANTRIYSALLIQNDCKHRWRGRYNEDTDLSLRVLKDGDCTVQFNAFLQGKLGTQILKGGNTEEFYHKEGDTEKEKWRQGNMNPTGTVNKSKMLYEMHPDVTTLVWKYGRAHHHVNYNGFMKRNKLKLREGLELKDESNEYEITFTDSYAESIDY